MPAELPAHPNLEQYKKQAKDLVKAFASLSADALARVRQHHPRLRDLQDCDVPIKLSDAQLVIAREHSFKTWADFARQVRALQQTANGDNSSQSIPVDGVELSVDVVIAERPRGLVLFACVSGTSRYNPKNRYITNVLNRAGLCTALADLLTEEEEIADIVTEELQFDIGLLRRRIIAITDWLVRRPQLEHLPVGYCGAGTASAAALAAATDRPKIVRAIVSSGGRPDLAGPWLGRVHAPTLLTVGGNDSLGVGFNYSAMAPFPRETVLGFERIEGAGHLFDEQAALKKSAILARDWFCRYLAEEQR